MNTLPRMLSYLANYAYFFGSLRLLHCITVRTLGATATALSIGFVVGPWLIRRFRALKLGHGYIDKRTGVLGATCFDKKHTPTMGGLIIFIAMFFGTVLWAEPNIWVFVALFVYTTLTIPGLRDDYLKVIRKNNDGIKLWEKVAWQTLATFVALGSLLWHPLSAERVRELWVSFFKTAVIEHMPWWLLLVLIYLWVVGFSNAINLTDGLDGLAVGCTITVTLAFGIMAYAAGNLKIADYLFISYVPGAGELTVLCGALTGACMAFLWFNSYPAEVFMGDTGSLALGGLIGVIAFMIHQPIALLIVGGVFVLELLSVVLQVGYFKYTRYRIGTGVRLLLMAPLHHHFQKRGWPETKVVLRFWLLSLAFALAGLSIFKLR